MNMEEVLGAVEDYLNENIEEGDTEFDVEELIVSLRITPRM